MKKLTSLLLRTYLGPFLATFFIAMFFLVMQFLWRYIDDLMGKGLDFKIILELMFYVSFNLVPMALPLAILLSSIMTFGALGESNELTAMKSSGMSLFRIMRPVTYFIICVSIGAFFFANYAWPWSNLKWKTLYWEILESKPAFQLSDKIFYNEIPNFTIRIDKKDAEGKKFQNVLIYDYSGNFNFRKRDVRANEGEILQGKNPEFMSLNLQNGVIYEEIMDGKLKGAIFPFRKTTFAGANLKFDVSGFKLSRGNEDLFKDSYEMLNIFQINLVTDSLQRTLATREKDYLYNIKNRHLIFRPHIDLANDLKPDKQDSLHQAMQQAHVNTGFQMSQPTPVKIPGNIGEKYKAAIELCQNSVTALQNNIAEVKTRRESLMKYDIEWHRKFTLSFACIVIFFIGAPLGAIVRKGGLGTPMVISVLLFLLYHILTITGEKMAKAYTLDPFTGMWFSAFILAPIGIVLTWLAASESSLVNVQTYFSSIARASIIFKIFRRKK